LAFDFAYFDLVFFFFADLFGLVSPPKDNDSLLFLRSFGTSGEFSWLWQFSFTFSLPFFPNTCFLSSFFLFNPCDFLEKMFRVGIPLLFTSVERFFFFHWWPFSIDVSSRG